MKTLLSGLCLLMLSTTGSGAERLFVFPESVHLGGPRQRMRLVIGTEGSDLTRQAVVATSDVKVAEVVNGVVVPRGNGRAILDVKAGGLRQTISVLVSGQEKAEPVSMLHEVLPSLTRQGCNAGACHGSPTGKGGFRLSLRGHDLGLDQATLLREAGHRRTNPLLPEESLLLLKPMMRVSHEGGQKLRASDAAYAVLRRWIEEGCRADPASPACVKIRVYPERRTLHWPAHEQQLCVLADFADGSTRDITTLAEFTTSDDAVAQVNADGLVTGRDRGEASILVRYAEHVAVSQFTQLRDVPGFAWPDVQPNNQIDELIYTRLRRLKIPPSPLCSDSEFIRRLYLDVLGVLPTPREVRDFLADSRADRRVRLIERTLSRPEYAEYAAHRWGDLLQVKAGKLSRSGAEKMHAWLLDAARTNVPYDRFARSLLTATGSTFANPPASYFRTSATSASRAENTAQLFLGARIQCAKCHNHPSDTWTQDAYHGIGAFFARVEQTAGPNPGEMIVALTGRGEITEPLSNRIALPRLPGVGLVKVPEAKDRREVFADWLTRPDNPSFARVAVNRVWGQLMGRGLVEPVDDFRVSNPPAHPELLDRLAADFVKDGYDLKKLTRTILQSRTYQLSSRTLPLNQADTKYFSHAQARLLPAEVLLDAISQVTGDPERFGTHPLGTRATQLPGPEGERPFLKTFGQPDRETSCACERSDEPKLSQALELIGGDLIGRKVRSSRSRLGMHLDDWNARLKQAGKPPGEGLVLWLDASRGVSGDRVSEWQDQSGGKRHVYQPGAAHRPILIADGIGGLPTIRFDGKDDFLNNTTADLMPPGSPRTILVVGRATSRGGALVAVRRQSTGGKPVFVAQQGTFQGAYYVYTNGVIHTGNSTLPAQTITRLRDPFVSVHLSAGADKKIAVRLGAESHPVVQEGLVGKDTGSTGFVVGNREDVAETMFPWDGDISEVLVYAKALTPTELEQAERYLSIRYNLPTRYRAVLPVKTAAQAEAADRELIAELYLAALSREPRAEEIKAALAHTASASDRRAGLEDVFWAVLNAKEFLFQH